MPPEARTVRLDEPTAVLDAVSDAVEVNVYCVHVEVNPWVYVPHLNPPVEDLAASILRLGDPDADLAQNDI